MYPTRNVNYSLFDQPEFSDPEDGEETLAGIQAVFDDWKVVMDYPHRKLTPKRRKHLSARLKNYSVDQLKQVLRIAARDPWWRGQNNRNTPYDDITNLFRNDERVDLFLSRGMTRDLSASAQPIETEEF